MGQGAALGGRRCSDDTGEFAISANGSGLRSVAAIFAALGGGGGDHGSATQFPMAALSSAFYRRLCCEPVGLNTHTLLQQTNLPRWTWP